MTGNTPIFLLGLRLLTLVNLPVADGHCLECGFIRWTLSVDILQQQRTLIMASKPQQSQAFQNLCTLQVLLLLENFVSLLKCLFVVAIVQAI